MDSENVTKCHMCSYYTYLPQHCHGCGHKFCSDHGIPLNHSCTAAVKNSVLPSSYGAPQHQLMPQQQLQHPTCSLCGVHDFAAVGCDDCGKTFCVSHRLWSDHNCSKAPARSTMSHNIARKLGGSGVTTPQTAPVITLGKSSIHKDDEVAFNISIPDSTDPSTNRRRRVVAHRRWSVGKTLDHLLDAFPHLKTLITAVNTNHGGSKCRWRIAVDGEGYVDLLMDVKKAVEDAKTVSLVKEFMGAPITATCREESTNTTNSNNNNSGLTFPTPSLVLVECQGL
eukprot:PhF_6_TR23778/c0_g1_i1/m.33263